MRLTDVLHHDIVIIVIISYYRIQCISEGLHMRTARQTTRHVLRFAERSCLRTCWKRQLQAWCHRIVSSACWPSFVVFISEWRIIIGCCLYVKSDDWLFTCSASCRLVTTADDARASVTSHTFPSRRKSPEAFARSLTRIDSYVWLRFL